MSDGYLLIAGPAGTDEAVRGFTLQHWAGPDGMLTKIGDVPPPKAGKAEGVLVLAESEAALDVLLFFDGAENGAPLQLRLIKPASR